MARITIIDDDVELAENTAATLRKAGHTLTLLHTTEDAMQRLTENKPDLVILDVMFPDNPVAGFDLARLIRRAKGTRKLPIILLTGINQQFPTDFSSKDIDPNWMPVQEFMEKPVNAPDLLNTVDRLLKKS